MVNGNGTGGGAVLPDWITPDPDAGEKGKLLFIERWAWKGRFRRKAEIFDALFGWILPPPLVILALRTLLFSDTMKGVQEMFIAFLTILIMIEATRSGLCMPFTIYKNGITRRRVSIRKILSRQEVFVPWSRVNGVRLSMFDGMNVPRQIMVDSGLLKHIKIDRSMIVTRKQRVDQKTSGSAITRRLVEHPDCLRIMRIFNDLVPEKLDEKALIYLRTRKY